jgi:Collagen triple helix repeat (20 copies)
MTSKKRLAALAGAVTVTLAGGAAWATIPHASGVIQGCYVTKSGALRVVASAADCKKSELAISWNQQGQKGDTGATGAPGQAGPKGEKGDKGDRGLDGAAGAQGPAGDQGPQGLQGLPGQDASGGHFAGPWSPRNYSYFDTVTHNGSSWYAVEFPGPGDVPGSSPFHWIQLAAKGDPGPQGERGAQGDRGPQGIPGQQGPQGHAGISGYEMVHGPGDHVVNPFASFSRDAVCPLGKNVLGGGFSGNDIGISESAPSTGTPFPGSPDRWTVKGAAGPLPGNISVFAICADV